MRLSWAAIACFLAARASAGEQRHASQAPGESVDQPRPPEKNQPRPPEKNQPRPPEKKKKQLPVTKARYTVRICNTYAMTAPLEVYQVRTATLLAALQYKECKDMRVEIEDGEQLDFRLPNDLRNIVEESGMEDNVRASEEEFITLFNKSDVTRDGLLNFKEFLELKEVLQPWQEITGGINRNHTLKQFKKIDTNDDNKVSIEEFIDWETFGSISEVGDDLIGTFVISGKLPDPRAFETLLLLAIHRSPKKKVGSYLSGSFVDHAFGPKELENMGKNAVLCVMDVYVGTDGKDDKVHIAYDNVPDGTNFSHGHHEVVPYGTVVGIHAGYYQLDLGRGHSEELDEEVFYARPQVNYVVLRIGDSSEMSEDSVGFAEELIVFPTPESAEKDRATITEVAAINGLSIALMIAAAAIGLGCVGGGIYYMETAGSSETAAQS